MDQSTMDALRSVPLFSGLNDDALARAAAIASVSEHPRGSVLMERGMPGAGLFVILDGSVAVELRHRTVELGAGETVGELSLLTDHTARVARARALTDVRALAIGANAFRDLLREEPQIALTLLSELARRLQDLVEHPA